MNTIKREFEYYGNIIPYDVCHTGLKEKSDMEYKNYEYIGSSCVYYINGVKNTSVDLIHFYKEKGEAREIDYYLVKKECWGDRGIKWKVGDKMWDKKVVGCNAKGLGTHKWEVTQEQIEKIISKIN